jgi:hypothetical protein
MIRGRHTGMRKSKVTDEYRFDRCPLWVDTVDKVCDELGVAAD